MGSCIGKKVERESSSTPQEEAVINPTLKLTRSNYYNFDNCMLLANKGVTVLQIPDVSLGCLDSRIGTLTRLEELNIAKNRLEELPDSIGQLICLKSLYAEDNQLTILPDSLGQLTSLEKLCLNKNQLSKVPLSIESLQNLQELHLNNNKFTQFPATIRTMANRSLYPNLENLQIFNNPIQWTQEQRQSAAEWRDRRLERKKELLQEAHGLLQQAFTSQLRTNMKNSEKERNYHKNGRKAITTVR